MASYTSKVIAILGRTVRSGRWKVADDSLVIALFGRCVLDLTRAYVDDEDDELSMSIFALFGSVTIELPAGCDVEPSGIAIVASSEVEIPSDRSADLTKAALAPLDIGWFAMFARVRIAEVRPDPSVTASASSSRSGALPPPAVEVFDAGPSGSGEAHPVAGDPDAANAVGADREDGGAETLATAESFDDPDSEAASLRDEIAAWRAESGRPSPSSAGEAATADDADGAVSLADEIIDEITDEPASDDEVVASDSAADTDSAANADATA